MHGKRNIHPISHTAIVIVLQYSTTMSGVLGRLVFGGGGGEGRPQAMRTSAQTEQERRNNANCRYHHYYKIYRSCLFAVSYKKRRTTSCLVCSFRYVCWENFLDSPRPSETGFVFPMPESELRFTTNNQKENAESGRCAGAQSCGAALLGAILKT